MAEPFQTACGYWHVFDEGQPGKRPLRSLSGSSYSCHNPYTSPNRRRGDIAPTTTPVGFPARRDALKLWIGVLLAATKSSGG